jgi:hypothetical protein
MRTREEIEDELRSSVGPIEPYELIRQLRMQTQVLLDIRDLLLASEERARQFAAELERLRK